MRPFGRNVGSAQRLAKNATQRDAQRGQVLPLFALLVAGILFMAALLFDGAQAVVARRILQNAADAGAVAAANVVQVGSPSGCSGGSGSTPRASVMNAALNGAAQNLNGLAATINVSCAAGYNDSAVKVDIAGSSPSFFGAVLRLSMTSSQAASWQAGIPVSASGTAIHGGAPGGTFSVVELNPHNSTWQSGKTGCPSMLISGGPTITFDGSVQVNSACPAASGGSLGTNGNSATLRFNNNARISLSGGFAPGPLVVNPAPLVNQPKLRDPLRNLPPVPVASLPVRSNSAYVVNGTTDVLLPGVYRGGIDLRSSAVALLQPGIYVLDGGGLIVGSQASIVSVAPGVTTYTPETWATTDCPPTNCGVLIFNRDPSNPNKDGISIGGQGAALLRPYRPEADINISASVPELRNLLVWQNATPIPTSNYIQPDVKLTGGGTFKISGTLYAPSARVFMTGGSGGSGGSEIELTLQFISWDLQIQGNSSFHFVYFSDNFARPIQYGLVE